MHCRRSVNAHPGYVDIGSTEIISRRNSVEVKCDPDCVVNDDVPQEDIAYLCCRFTDLVASDVEWCFTDGNAATDITAFFTDEDDLPSLDWHSVYSTDWGDNNKDGDHDRMRKKMSEFLVKGHVPSNFIRRIVVKTEERKKLVEQWVAGTPLAIRVFCDQPKFYF